MAKGRELKRDDVIFGAPRWAYWAGAAGLLTVGLGLRAPARTVCGVAAGLAAACAWLSSGTPARRAARPVREWYSDFEPGPDGRLRPDDLVDDASQDSFPASDPPGYRLSRTGGLLNR